MKKCIICGEMFEPRTDRQITCASSECREERKKQTQKALRKKGRQIIVYKRNCKMCGKLFETTDSRKIYCDKPCQRKATAEKVKESRKSQKVVKKPETKKKTRAQSLHKAAVEARKLHMSYGQYVAMQEGARYVR